MSISGLIRQLKKQLRKNRSRLSLGLWLIAVGVVCVAALRIAGGFPDDGDNTVIQAVWSPEKPGLFGPADEQKKKLLATVRERKGPFEVTVRKRFVCGEETQWFGNQTAADIEAMWQTHPDWEAALQDKHRLVFIETVDDLSPSCKQNAYIGVDRNGNLSLFEGEPGREQVIRTFFQLNIQYLESSLPEETIRKLHNGIKISDYAEYNSVLSTFSDYAVEEYAN